MRSIERDLTDRVAKFRVGDRKPVGCYGELLRQVFPHADLLGALAREKEGNRFRHGETMTCE